MAPVLETLPGFDLLPRVPEPVLGIDPSSKRIAAALLEPDAQLSWQTVSLSQAPSRSARFADALRAQVAFFRAFAPAVVYLEEPFLPRDRREAPTHVLMYGVTLAALGIALPGVPVVEIGTNVWKSRALGAGRGAAKPAEYLRWAQSVGYSGAIEDEAAAIGVAVGGAILAKQRS